MSKFAIMTIAIDETFQLMAEWTHPLIQRYAEKIGADFISIKERKVSKTTPHWEKFQLFDYLNTYDRIIYLDTDLIVRKNCPNLFDIVPETHLGLFNDAPYVPKREFDLIFCSEQYEQNDFKWDKKYYNTGVMVVSKRHRQLFRKPAEEISNFFEQSYLNLAIHRIKPQIFDLNYKFNRLNCVDKITGEHRYESYIIHYAGYGYKSNGFGILQNDIETIEALPDDYTAPKQVWIVVQGGIGDQMQAEPSIRYALRHVWPGSDLRISTHFPELFHHLPVICKKHEENVWKGCNGGEPITRVSMPGPETVNWVVVSNMMTHTVDYCSMAMLGRTLPDIDKTYQLSVDQTATQSVMQLARRNHFKDCVLIHAGRHWESKTFPIEWWQNIVDGVIELGLTPVFVGHDTAPTQGVLQLDGRGKSIDLTNALALQEFIAAVALVPILITNDSAPLHLAGAFDNWIIVVPTVKHPDHILPYRHGTKSYKTAALYKKLALDDINSSTAEATGQSADKLKGEWKDYLPDVQTVLDKVHEFYIESKKQTSFD